jgi:hypothetical protein
MDLIALAVPACVCAMVCVLVAGAGSAAAATEFGEEGEHLGQFNGNLVGGLAVDNNAMSSSVSDVYLADPNNNRIVKFTGLGGPLLAWGWQVNEEAPATELQTCTTLCQRGRSGTGAGEFGGSNLRGVAVDNNAFSGPLTGSAGDVYTVDQEDFRVEKFDPEGKFILMFGWEVNETTHGNVCIAGERCEAGVRGEREEGTNEHGQFRWNEKGSYIAVGPGGKVYVGDQARVQIFEESGAYKEEISLAGLSNTQQVNALAVDASGDVFVADEGANGVHEFNASGTEIGAVDTTSEGESIKGLAVDASGDLYVEDSEGGYHFLKYDLARNELVSFGSRTVEESHGIAFANAAGALYVAGRNFKEEPRVFVFRPPPPGPLMESGSESGTPERRGAAKLAAEINAEGHETTYHVEYISDEQFKTDGETYGAGTVGTAESASIGEGFEDQHVEESLPEKTLEPGVTYHWRIVATDSLAQNTTGPDKTLEETPPAVIDGPWATEVTSTSATLAARINPEGANTSYRLEYGTSTAYGQGFEGNAGAGTAFVAVGGYLVEGLRPNTTYHYRVVTVNECMTGKTCAQAGADHTFTTRPGASEFALPDGRTWELVTPADTGGASLELSTGFGGIQAASDGSAITYGEKGVPLGEDAVSNNSLWPIQVLSRRGPHGWGSKDINTPIKPPKEGEDYSVQILFNGSYNLFSSDLESAIFSPQIDNGVLTSEALEGTNYLRNAANGSYTPLLTSANTPPGTELMAKEEAFGAGAVAPKPQVIVLAGTPDLGHILVGSPVRLTGEAVDYLPHEINRAVGNLYEWSGSGLRLVNILPSGKTDKSDSAQLAGERGANGQIGRAVSSDGRRVAWTVGSRYQSEGSESTFSGLYVRDMVEEKTVHVGGIGAYYQTMSRDGSRVFFLEKGDLYVYEAGTPIDLTANHGPGESSAGAQEIVSDVSEDGSYDYFVAKGVLSSGANAMKEKAVSGADNLYLLHNEGGVWKGPKFIARLAGEDEKSWSFHAGSGEPELTNVTSRVSPDGRFLAFMSSRSLTGYDNVDLNPEAKGARDEEVFLYHAPEDLATESGSLICASCDPSGARPHGVLSGSGKPLLVEPSGNPAWPGHWLAGNLPGRILYGAADTVYQPRYLSEGGRLFFNSPIALVPQDTNGLEDVYQYEPAGAGGCGRVGGCVDLISSGQSAFESAFMDASESGEDVFFLSLYNLTAADKDNGFDVWDAHVCSASSPCLTPPVSRPPCSSGDSCKPAPSPQPELFGVPPSATFSGVGNLAPPVSKPAVRRKRLTRAQKLAKALGACHKKKKPGQRVACEHKAHKQYGYTAKPSHNANAIKRGGK